MAWRRQYAVHFPRGGQNVHEEEEEEEEGPDRHELPLEQIAPILTQVSSHVQSASACAIFVPMKPVAIH